MNIQLDVLSTPDDNGRGAVGVGDVPRVGHGVGDIQRAVERRRGRGAFFRPGLTAV
ncbi:MAG TPA: hypothetical protein VKJ45_17055 [Blastocatellia bacterium]|nr:hypothetical protein [Blastocatellia bacterium]